jgi:hypothetical protein
MDEASKLIYIADYNSKTIRLVDISASTVSLLATLPSSTMGIALDTIHQLLYVTCPLRNAIYRIDLSNNNAVILFAGSGQTTSKF